MASTGASIRFSGARVARIACAIGGACAAIVLMPVAETFARHIQDRWAARIQPLPATASEQKAMVSAALTWYERRHAFTPFSATERAGDDIAQASIAIVDATAPYCPDDEAYARAPACVSSNDMLQGLTFGRISTRWIRELVDASRRPVPFVVPALPFVWRAPTQAIDALPRGDGYWTALLRLHAGTDGVVHVSRAVLTGDRTHALLYLEFQNETFGFGSFLVLRRSGDEWQVDYTEGVWIT